MRCKFTDRTVKALAPGSAQVDCFDEDRTLPGFGIRVAPSGVKSWIVVYKQNGRTRRLTLGRYPIISLADARQKAKVALAQVTQGEDPAEKKKVEREAATFGKLVETYLERHAKPKKRSWREDERMLGKYVPKSWKHRRADEITRPDVRDVLAEITPHAPIMANRVLACLRKVFNFGVRWGLMESNPATMIERPAAERQRDRVLSADELRGLWSAIEAEPEENAVLFKLYLFTAQRGGELRTMRWEDIDLDAAWWTVPAERAKNGLAHRVPLSTAAVALLRSLQLEDADPFVFASSGAAGHRDTVRKLTRRLRTASGVDFVPHDLRRTVATFLTSELGVSRLVVSKLLNHVESGVTAVYDRASYDREKRTALETWAAYLAKIVSGATTTAKVIPIRA